jgi:hypothetical protein
MHVRRGATIEVAETEIATPGRAIAMAEHEAAMAVAAGNFKDGVEISTTVGTDHHATRKLLPSMACG